MHPTPVQAESAAEPAVVPERSDPPRRKRRRRPADPRQIPAWLLIPLGLLTLGGAFYFASRGDLVTAASLITVSFCCVTGFRMGLSAIASTLLGLAAAIALAPTIGLRFESEFSQQFGTTGLTNRLLCIAAVGILISLVVTIVATFIGNRVLGKRRRLHWANHFVGFSLGAVEGLVLVWLVLGGAISMQIWQRDLGIEQQEMNQVALAVDRVAAETRQSALGPIVIRFNPFETIEPLGRIAEVHRTVHRLSQPGSIDQLLNDPSVHEIGEDPEIRSAIDEIRRDPVIVKLIEEGEPVTPQLITRLMEHPAVLRLVDNPEFVRRARELVDQME